MKADAASMPFDPAARTTLERLVARYQAEELSPSAGPLRIHGPLAWPADSEDRWNLHPASGRPGCYIAYGPDGSAIYVGKASCRKRVGDRLRPRQMRPESDWQGVAWIDIVEVREAFQAPSLEEYLLANFPTAANVNGVAPARDERR